MKRVRQGTDSDIILNINLWANKIVGQFSDNISLENEDLAVRLENEDQFEEEIGWASYLGVPALLGPEINSMGNSNYASMILLFMERQYKMPFWVPINLQDPTSSKSDHMWKVWSFFHKQLNYCAGVQPCLRLPPFTPDPSVLDLWKAESVESFILPISLFSWSGDNKVSLPSWCEELICWYKYSKPIRLIIEGECTDESQQLRIIFNYFQHLFQNAPSLSPFEQQLVRYDDMVQLPLQPLMDNLQNATYDVFERDHVKYQLYEQALEEVLGSYVRSTPDNVARYAQDGTLLPSTNSLPEGYALNPACCVENRIIITLVGAGRGPLILCSLKAAAATKRDIIIYAVEKNPNAVQALHVLHKQFQWGENVKIIEADMRVYKPEYYSDIILSELLGSFGDNELSPECLIGAQRFMLCGGRFIPKDSTSLMCCCMSSPIYRNVLRMNSPLVSKPSEVMYVAKMRSTVLLSDVQPVFTFHHPDRRGGEFRSFKEIAFTVQMDGLVHGFAGYFESNVPTGSGLPVVIRPCLAFDRSTESL